MHVHFQQSPAETHNASSSPLQPNQRHKSRGRNWICVFFLHTACCLTLDWSLWLRVFFSFSLKLLLDKARFMCYRKQLELSVRFCSDGAVTSSLWLHSLLITWCVSPVSPPSWEITPLLFLCSALVHQFMFVCLSFSLFFCKVLTCFCQLTKCRSFFDTFVRFFLSLLQDYVDIHVTKYDKSTVGMVWSQVNMSPHDVALCVAIVTK